MKTRKPLFDWMVHFGFYPYQPVDCSVRRVSSLLASGGVTHAALASYRGLFYDAVAGNLEVNETITALEGSSNACVTWHAVGTLNPQTGWTKVAQGIEAALSQNIKLFRFYPNEQRWTIGHPAFVQTIERLNASEVRAVLIDDQFCNIITLRKMLSERIAIITNLHFYTMSEWMDELFKLPSVYLTLLHLHGPGVIPDIIQGHGSDRLLYASNTPLGSTGAISKMLKSLPDHDKLLDSLWANGEKILSGRG